MFPHRCGLGCRAEQTEQQQGSQVQHHCVFVSLALLNPACTALTWLAGQPFVCIGCRQLLLQYCSWAVRLGALGGWQLVGVLHTPKWAKKQHMALLRGTATAHTSHQAAAHAGSITTCPCSRCIAPLTSWVKCSHPTAWPGAHNEQHSASIQSGCGWQLYAVTSKCCN